jgi:hypothetical protein
MTDRERFVFGAVGALAVEVLRYSTYLVRQLLPHDGAAPPFHPWYLFVSASMVVVGGAVSVGWKSDHRIKCMMDGATWPLFFQAIAHPLFGAEKPPAAAPCPPCPPCTGP